MLTLESAQIRMRDALLSKEAVPLEDILGPSAARFEIHRRHFIRSITASLENTFPAVVSLVDARFFAFAADAFIRAQPPVSPCLFDYGAELADFLEAFPACAALPYLGDVARLEWAMHRVFHAEEEHKLGDNCLPQSVRLVSSHWPVDAIWRVAMGRAEGPVDMNAGTSWILIYRDDSEVKFESLSKAAFTFHTNIQKHGRIFVAREEARKVDLSFDEQEAVAQLERAAARSNIIKMKDPKDDQCRTGRPSGAGIDDHDLDKSVDRQAGDTSLMADPDARAHRRWWRFP